MWLNGWLGYSRTTPWPHWSIRYRYSLWVGWLLIQQEPMQDYKVALIALLIIVPLSVGAIVLNTKPIEYVEAVATTTPIDVRDNAQKLADHLANSMRSLEQARQTQARAMQALEDANKLYDESRNGFNSAVSAINLYQGTEENE